MPRHRPGFRSEELGIMVGTNTAKYDNPSLNVRDWKGKNPTRIVIDKQLKLDQKLLNLFDGKQATICYNLIKTEEKENLTFVRLTEENFLESLLEDLYQRKVQSVLVEGGSQLLQSFLDLNVWNEAKVFKSKTTFGKGIAAPVLRGTLVDNQQLMDDQLFHYVNFKLSS